MHCTKNEVFSLRISLVNVTFNEENIVKNFIFCAVMYLNQYIVQLHQTYKNLYEKVRVGLLIRPGITAVNIRSNYQMN